MRNTLLVLVPSLILAAGCMSADSDPKPPAGPINRDEVGFVCCIMVDQTMGERGWVIVQKAVDKYVRSTASSNVRLLVGQMAGKGSTFIFDGTAQQFHQKYATIEELRKDLSAGAGPGSKCYDTTQEAIRRIMEYPAIAEGRGRSTLIVISPMNDTASDNSGKEGHKAINFLYGALSSYSKVGGSVSLLHVQDGRVHEWEQAFRALGYKQGYFTVQSDIVEDPFLLDVPEQ